MGPTFMSEEGVVQRLYWIISWTEASQYWQYSELLSMIFLICVTTIRWNYLVHVGYETSLSHNSRPCLWILHMGFTFMWEGGVVHNPYQGYVKWLKFRKQADRLSRKKVAWVEIFVVIVPYGSGEANMVALASIPSFPLMEWWCIRA